MVSSPAVYILHENPEWFPPLEAAFAAEGTGAFRPFQLREAFNGNPIIRQYLAFLAGIGAEVAGIEFIETADGRIVTYDVNTNTNYNPDVEAQAAHPGARRVAQVLGGLLAKRYALEAY